MTREDWGKLSEILAEQSDKANMEVLKSTSLASIQINSIRSLLLGDLAVVAAKMGLEVKS